MPTSDSRLDVLVDTSVAVALILQDHEHHGRTVDALGGRRLGLAGQAIFETYSVLTRLPAPARRAPSAVAELIRENFAHLCVLSDRGCRTVLDMLPVLGISGGAVYDALVAGVAVERGVPLATRDRRALATYRAFEVSVELIA